MNHDVIEAPVSIVIPAKNEFAGVSMLIPRLKAVFPNAEIILVDDGSNDGTGDLALSSGATVKKHAYSIGNGGAIKSGLALASHDIVITMDADGQHRPEDAANLYKKFKQSGLDMVVGARDSSGQASAARKLGNTLYNRLASWVVGHEVKDLTSGLRVVDRKKALRFIELYPNGFSYPTTITMAFFRSGYGVGYESINVQKRMGKSHLRIFKDGAKFFLIIFKICTLYSPLKLFVPVSVMFFLLGALNYAKTYITSGTFTNMSALMFVASILVFLIGLVSEQITALLYKRDS